MFLFQKNRLLFYTRMSVSREATCFIVGPNLEYLQKKEENSKQVAK